MSLTLPVEVLSRLQVAFKVVLPEGGFSFEMAPTPTPCSTRPSDLKLHFRGTHDETGCYTVTVWMSGSPQDIHEDSSLLDYTELSISPCEQLPFFGNHILEDEEDLGFPEVSATSLNSVFNPVPSFEDSNAMSEECIDNSGLDLLLPYGRIGSRLLENELEHILDGSQPFIVGWNASGSFDEIGAGDSYASQYSDLVGK
ncbi:hypothetical protein C8R43DRAFT_1116791 [Mycena crocata]|nr:hypothetical protein C8R43DRAFT_1116791 [Mycena crocata]